ncbi:MAG: HD domain-containing protein [Candidatus Daviesbacteria bacterium]|nr:HD domain-containing protein [Candidatus Daviesbacteria bacterium]
MPDRIDGISHGDDINLLWVNCMQNIKRYDGLEMIHRPDLWTHIRRVGYLSKVLSIYISTRVDTPYSLDAQKTFRMGLRHDDPELITTDIPAPVKRQLSIEQLQHLKAQEQTAGIALARYLYCYPEDSPLYKLYVSEQGELIQKETPEAQIVDVADKWDAVCEILHDIRCGNKDYISLLEFSRKTLAKFERYPFWNMLADEFGLANIPNDEEITHLSKIGIDDLVDRSKVSSLMRRPATDEWPEAYKIWGELNANIFYRNPEKYIFPGWYLNLWQKWETPPKDTTTVSGIIIPK